MISCLSDHVLADGADVVVVDLERVLLPDGGDAAAKSVDLDAIGPPWITSNSSLKVEDL